MVTVTMLRKDARTVGFISNGHANHGEAGEDIVCSAISALTQTCCLGLVEVIGLKEGKDLVYSIDDAEGIHCVLADDTLFATVDGVVRFETKHLGKKQVSVYEVAVGE